MYFTNYQVHSVRFVPTSDKSFAIGDKMQEYRSQNELYVDQKMMYALRNYFRSDPQYTDDAKELEVSLGRDISHLFEKKLRVRYHEIACPTDSNVSVFYEDQGEFYADGKLIPAPKNVISEVGAYPIRPDFIRISTRYYYYLESPRQADMFNEVNREGITADPDQCPMIACTTRRIPGLDTLLYHQC